MTAIVEMVLTPCQARTVDDLESHWRAREAAKRWDTCDETCERLLTWLRQETR